AGGSGVAAGAGASAAGVASAAGGASAGGVASLAGAGAGAAPSGGAVPGSVAGATAGGGSATAVPSAIADGTLVQVAVRTARTRTRSARLCLDVRAGRRRPAVADRLWPMVLPEARKRAGGPVALLDTTSQASPSAR